MAPQFFKSVALRGNIKNYNNPDVSIFMGSNFHFVIYPVNKNVWIFGAGNGQTFSDNSKYFFLFLLKNKTNEKPICITQNKRVIQEIKDLGGAVYHNLSFFGIHYILLAKYLVWSTRR